MMIRTGNPPARLRPVLSALLRQIIGIALLAGPSVSEELIPVGELTDIEGVRNNHLRGIGLVMGLNQTGDQAQLSRQLIASFLQNHNISVPVGNLSSKNIAVVSVTATLPPFKNPGSKIDVTISSMGDASSLFGGILLETQLSGTDGKVYALAQGPVSVGGFSIGGAAATVGKNHPTVGRILGGGLVEESVPMRIVNDLDEIVLLLRNPSFTTARRIAESIKKEIGLECNGFDAATARFQVPENELGQYSVPRLITRMHQVRVAPEPRAKIIINERTGTIVAGNSVLITSVSIAHGDLRISIAETPLVSQPEPFSEGETTVVPRTDVSVEEGQTSFIRLEQGISAAEMAEALNSLGVTPRDLSDIFQALKMSGALHAEIEFM